jgi:hypothetical protein
MTNSEFQAAVVKLSPKIQSSLAAPNGAGIASALASMAFNLTETSDLSAALAALTADPSKFSALETSVAASVAAIPQPAAAPALAPSSAPAATTARPVRGLMWVGPVVSFAVIAGFFSMLTVLLWDEHQPPAPPAALVTVNQAGASGAPNAGGSAAPATAGAAETAGGTASAGKSSPAITVAPAAGTTNPLQNVLFTLLGALGAAFTQVVNFWLGSSKGSSDKTDFLAATNPALKTV